ncbi:MAG: dihydropteroate synthase [Clostridia bacterium]|nr:dihydropteroate synthase [Clostridia bacterium]
MKQLRQKDGSLFSFEKMEFMGILNVTPDSFFPGSRVSGIDSALMRAEMMIADGAAFLDIGGESTRPGSAPVTVEEEIERVCPVIRALKEAHPGTVLSVDTYHAKTAEAACDAGVDMINDISAFTFDENMVRVAAEREVPVVLMHISGRPDHMQDHPHYDDVVEEVHSFLAERIEYAEANGVREDRIVFDLGIGFGKTYDHNVTLLREIDRFSDFGLPQLLAVSRKTFIGVALDRQDPAERLNGTIGVSCYAAMHGVEMARVHDVRENLEAVRMIEALR